MGVTNYQIVAGDNVDLVVDDNAKTVTIDVTDSASNFTDLLDVPSSYTGAELKIVRVNAGADALEFVDPTGSGLNEVQAIAYSASITPDISSGNVVDVGVLTGDITVNNPTNTTEGQEIYIRFEQDGTGGRDVTLGANFVLLDSNTSYDQSPSAVFYFTGLTKDAGIIEGGFSPVVGTQVASEINAADSKTTPVDADELGIVDTEASNVLKKLTWANLKATLLAYFLPFFSRPNILINTNGLDPINQAGATTVATGGYGFDMWKVVHTCTTVTISATATGMRHTVTTKGAGTYMYPVQLIENYASYIGKEITAVTKVKSNLPVVLGLSNTVAYFAESTAHAGDGGTQILSVTGTLGAGATGLAVVLRSGNVAADGDYIEWEWIKLEEGSVATPYAVPSKGQELIDCKRYFQRIKNSGAYGGVGLGFGGTSTIGFIMRFLDVPMRALPALASSTPSNMLVYGDGAQIALTSLGINSDNSCLDGSGACISVGMTIGVASGLPVDHAIYVRWNNDANGYIDLSARL